MSVVSATYLDATFGVEIECFLPVGVSHAQAAEAVRTRGIDCRPETYGHVTRTWWKVITDGSLGDYARGAEFVSPKLTGTAGLAQVETVCRALSDLGCTVNKKCGLHVHVGVAGQPIAFFRNLVKLYGSFESVIDQLMPPSRRASGNTYCRSITHVRPADVDTATSLAALIARIGDGRFYKLNLTAFARHGTVEFRQHSGSVDAVKVRNWAVICLRLVAAAKAPAAPVVTAPGRSANKARIGSKAWRVGQMLLRAEGVTGPEIMLALNWPSVSIPAQARACGLEFTTRRMGRVVRYFARAAAVESNASAPITVDGFASVLSADADLAAWIRQRATDLGGSVAWAA